MSFVPKLPASRALARLDAAIAAATDAGDAACLRAERAALLARHGRLEDARAELDALRGQQQPRVQAWVALADGLAHYFSNLDASARARVREAYELSASTRQVRLHALAAAWLAHMDLVLWDDANLARHVTQALQLSTPDDHAARARACLVAAIGLHHAGRYDLALPWYGAARRHALQEGDDATISALMHNMAWLRGSQARTESIFGGLDLDQVRQTLLGAESSSRFDEGVGTTSLQSLVPILRAQVLVVLGRHEEALALYGEALAAALVEGLARMECFFRADIAWSNLQLGQRPAALIEARRAIALLDDEVQVDDLACTHGRLAQVFDAVGDAEKAGEHRAHAEAGIALYREQQQRLLATLQDALKGMAAG